MERKITKEKLDAFVKKVKEAFAQKNIVLDEKVIQAAMFEGKCSPMHCTTTCASGCTVYCSVGTH